jgi:hypothetical protein
MMSYIALQPAAALMVLTLLVWVYMYILRLPYIINNRIKVQSLLSPDAVNTLLPEHVNRPANNLKNLFELPILFFVLCLAWFLSQQVDPVFVNLAWVFVALRYVHSLIHCTVNIVVLRFVFYVLSSFVLVAMVARFVMLVF